MAKILCVVCPDLDVGDSPNYIVMTGHGEMQTAMRAMKIAGDDFIERPPSSTIDQARALAGQVSREGEPAAARDKAAALSRREREVLDGLVAGKPNKVIAYDLGISVRTVEVHRARMLQRLGTRSTAEAIRLAVMATLAPHPLRSSGDADRKQLARDKQAREKADRGSPKKVKSSDRSENSRPDHVEWLERELEDVIMQRASNPMRDSALQGAGACLASAKTTCRTTPGRPRARSSASRSYFAKITAGS